jgi:hypothetical protein
MLSVTVVHDLVLSLTCNEIFPMICGGASELELAKVIAAQMFYFILIFLPSPSSKIFSLDRGMRLRGLAIIWEIRKYI